MSCRVTYTRTGVDVRFTGVVAGAEVYQASADMCAHHYEDSLRYCIYDFTDTTRLDLDAPAIRRIAKQDKMRLADRHELVVAVVAAVPHHFGLARMWQGYVEGARLQSAVLRSRASAMEYLRHHGIEA